MKLGLLGCKASASPPPHLREGPRVHSVQTAAWRVWWRPHTLPLRTCYRETPWLLLWRGSAAFRQVTFNLPPAWLHLQNTPEHPPPQRLSLRHGGEVTRLGSHRAGVQAGPRRGEPEPGPANTHSVLATELGPPGCTVKLRGGAPPCPTRSSREPQDQKAFIHKQICSPGKRRKAPWGLGPPHSVPGSVSRTPFPGGHCWPCTMKCSFSSSAPSSSSCG